MPKVHNKLIKRPKKDSNIESKSQPKCVLVWRIGLSGAPPDSVRCTRDSNSDLLTFGNSRSHSAIIHRTVRCASEATATSCQRSSAEGIPCLLLSRAHIFRLDLHFLPDEAAQAVVCAKSATVYTQVLDFEFKKI